MQDIRKPYSHSKSSHPARSISSRVEDFENHNYRDEIEEDAAMDDGPVYIPTRTSRTRRNIDDMEMYPRRGESRTVEEMGGVRNVYKDPRTRYKRGRPSTSTLIFSLIVGLIIALILLLTFVFNKATITISPKYQDLDSFNRIITFNKETSDTSSVPFIVATTTISKSKSLIQSETKTVETKASGKIVVYNNYSTDSQRLIKNTRFESPNGKIYRINQSITVPGKSGDTPGSIEVTVYADSVGADYNSDPIDFTIPGFKGTPQYSQFYARSKGSITGGFAGTVSRASLSDINAAKDELALSLSQQIKTEMSSIIKVGYVGLYDDIQILYEDNEEEVLVGETNIYKVTATGYIVFAQAPSLAKTIATNTVRDYNGESVDLAYEDTLKFTPQTTENYATSTKFSILVQGNPRIIWHTDKDELRELVSGRKRSEFKDVMKSVSSISGAETSFFPMWLRSFPSETKKIIIVEVLPNR